MSGKMLKIAKHVRNANTTVSTMNSIRNAWVQNVLYLLSCAGFFSHCRRAKLCTAIHMMIVESVVIVSNRVCMCARENRLKRFVFIYRWMGRQVVAIQCFINWMLFHRVSAAVSELSANAFSLRSNGFIAHAYRSSLFEQNANKQTKNREQN